MSGPTQSDRDQVTYRTYDNREISREMIERTLRALDTGDRSRAFWRRPVVLLVVLLIAAVAVAVAVFWWHLGL